MSLVWSPDYAPVDGDFADVSLLLKGEGTNGSTTILDSSSNNNSVSVFDNAQISTAVNTPFGTGDGVLAFDGTGDYLSIPPSSAFDYTSSDFTWECWVYFNTFSGIQAIISDPFYSGGPVNGFALVANINVAGVFGYSNTASPFVTVGFQTILSVNSWYHFAFTRNGNDYRFFLNGVQEGSAIPNGTAVTYNNDNLDIGTWGGFVGSRDLDGYISNLRITKGVARYTSNFTPPTAPFPIYSPTTRAQA